MTAKQRRFERTVIGYLERIERKVDAVCKAAGIDPETLIDFDTLRAIEDNAEGDQGFDAQGEELQPDPSDGVIPSESLAPDASIPDPSNASNAEPPAPKAAKPGSSKPKAS